MDIFEPLPLDLPLAENHIIKVIGVGGGGGNAVNHMYRQGIRDVSFVVCNTDNQALIKSPVPNKVQLGTTTTEGLGAGGRPEVAGQAAEESIEKIKEILDEHTKMVFVTAGMGGGTGTGASPVVAKTARELKKLTVGIVTIPFAFEGKPKIERALAGVYELSQYVDAILVINNEKLSEIYPDFSLSNAFAKADDVLTSAAKAIAEIITVPGYINTDFADVYNTLKDGRVAIMNTGYASGENRVERAIENALNSPLVNTNDVTGARKVLLSLYCSSSNEIRMDEVQQIHRFMDRVGENVEVIWGATFDDSLGDEVKITIIATGFEVADIPGMPPIAPIHRDDVAGEIDTVIDAAVPTAAIAAKEDFQKAVDELYGNKVNPTPAPVVDIEEEEEDIEEIDIDAMDDDQLDELENIPAFLRNK